MLILFMTGRVYTLELLLVSCDKPKPKP